MCSESAIPVKFFYDTTSPYSWLAFEVLCRYETRWNLEVHMIPIRVGSVMCATGNKPPATVKTKIQFLKNDLIRNSMFYGVNWKGMPANFMAAEDAFSSRPAQKLLTAACMKWGDLSAEVRKLSRAFFERFMNTGARQKVIVDDDLLTCCCRIAGFGDDVAEALLAHSKSEEVEQKMEAVANDAIAAGGFGVPIIVIESPLLEPSARTFFGSDRFEQIAFLLKKEWNGPNPTSHPTT